jgi:hypothetical protein
METSYNAVMLLQTKYKIDAYTIIPMKRFVKPPTPHQVEGRLSAGVVYSHFFKKEQM